MFEELFTRRPFETIFNLRSSLTLNPGNYIPHSHRVTSKIVKDSETRKHECRIHQKYRGETPDEPTIDVGGWVVTLLLLKDLSGVVVTTGRHVEVMVPEESVCICPFRKPELRHLVSP